MELDGNMSQLNMSLGSFNMHNIQYLDDTSTCASTTEVSAHVVNSYYDNTLDNDSVTCDTSIADATCYKSKRNRTTAKNLYKIWKISQETAQRTIGNTTKRCVKQADTSMKRNYSYNDRTMRHKRLDEYFCMDTFYAKKDKSIKSLRQNTFFQLFVTDKGCTCDCPMKNNLIFY